MDRKRTGAVLALIVLLAVLWGLTKYPWSSGTEEKLSIRAFSLGKADALLLQSDGTAILVDTGEKDDGEDLERELQDLGIERLNLLIVTHFDKDHVGGAAYLLGQMEADTVVMPDYEGSRPEYDDFLSALAGHPDVRRLSDGAEEFAFPDITLKVYPAENPREIQDTKGEYDNDMSLVTSVVCGERSFLLTGDIEETRIRAMLDAGTDWKHDWIKMPHHGRYENALAKLVEAVQPKWAVICCSNKNPADEETLALLQERNISVWDTKDRTVVTRCDGREITVEYE